MNFTSDPKVLLKALLVFSSAILAMTQPLMAQGWSGYGRDPQHTAVGANGSQLFSKIRWSTPVDLAPQYRGGDLLIHYGSPVITRTNSVLVPVKTGANGGYRVDAFRASTATGNSPTPFWSLTTDYITPPHNWVPSMGMTLLPKDKSVVIPGAGGTVLVRTFPDSATGSWSRIAFYGNAVYAANPTTFNNNVFISTPITSDANGNIYFGFQCSTTSSLPGLGVLPSGLARISSNGVGSYVSAATLANDTGIVKVNQNCAPAISRDGASVYVGVNTLGITSIGQFGTGYLCQANSTTLAPLASMALHDPHNGNFAAISDDGTSSPTVGPDDDVYFGVLENGFPSNHARGWLLHFNKSLSTLKTPSAFGWDDTASIVPANIVASYKGTSSYLLLTKYNNYADTGIGGDGLNRVAIVDPNAKMVDPITGTMVMQTVITVLGPTNQPNGGLPGVREWCINTAAIDTVNKCAVINCEDGHVYRWDFTTNSLTAALNLAPATAEAYTPTLIGPDGAIYAINNGILNCCSQ